MRAAKIGYIVMSAALCVLGILLICLPEVFSGLIGVLIGIILIVFGAVRMAGYFSKDLYRGVPARPHLGNYPYRAWRHRSDKPRKPDDIRMQRHGSVLPA